MASVEPTYDSKMDVTQGMKYVWRLAAGDTGQKGTGAFGGYSDKTVQVTGTFGSVTIRGSNKANPNDATSGDWFTLSDPQGNDLTFTAAGGSLIAENPLWISPITTGGSGYEVIIVGVK